MWDFISSLQKHTLVRRWYFDKTKNRHVGVVRLQWTWILDYPPKFCHLMNDWYKFHFMSQEDSTRILATPWVRGCSFLSLHNWYIGFNPMKETPKDHMIWVKLLGLPLEYWTCPILANIGNNIGHFIYADEKCLGQSDKRVTWLLMEIGFFGDYRHRLI